VLRQACEFQNQVERMAYPSIKYHYSIWFPPNIGYMCLDFFENISEIQSTYHFKNQVLDDPKGILEIPTKRDLMHPSNTLVEASEFIDENDLPTGKLHKLLIRCHHFSYEYDLCFVLANDGFLITTWANDKTDIHNIEKSKDTYYSPILNTNIEYPRILSNGKII
jgi:hypothetical protein